MLRLASSSKVVPNTVRAISSSRILSPSISVIHNQSYASMQSFSTVADAQKRVDKELAKLLKSKIKLAKRSVSETQMPEAPTSLAPFGILDNPGETTIQLTRDFAGEIGYEKIVVEVKEPWNPEDRNVNSDSSDDVNNDSDDENSSKDSIEEEKPRKISNNEPHCLFTVTISAKYGEGPKLYCRANVDSIAIESIVIHGNTINLVGSTDCMEYYWKNYVLAKRGIDDSIGGFLVDCAIRKFRRDRLIFLEKFRKFVKELYISS